MTREEKAKQFFEDLISETNRVLADRPDKLHEVKCVITYYEAAIEALQERPKGRCRFCKDMDIINELVCYLPKENGSAVDVPINFCPKCGADMKGE